MRQPMPAGSQDRADVRFGSGLGRLALSGARRGLIGIWLIPLFVCGAVFAYTRIDVDQRLDALFDAPAVLARLGQHRASTERIMMIAAEAFARPDDEGVRQDLRAAVLAWWDDGADLLPREVELSTESSGLYEEIAPVDELVVSASRALMVAGDPGMRRELVQEISAQTQRYALGVDALAGQLEGEFREGIHRIRGAEVAHATAFAVVVGALVMLVFVPLGRRNRSIAKDYADLRSRFARRTRQLRGAIRRARAASRSRSSFFSCMNHELRTPLNGVIGMADLLHRTHLDRDQQDYVRVMRTSAESLSSLIDDILDYSDLEAGRVRFRSETFDLRDVLFECARMVLPAARAKDIHVWWSIDPELPRIVRGDRIRLRQVLHNLTAFAVRSASVGAVIGRVSGTYNGDLLFEAAVCTRDDSNPHQGASAETLALIGHGAAASPDGIGMEICQRLVEGMHGQVKVEMGQDGVLCVWCVLPCGISTGDVGVANTESNGERALVVFEDERHRRHLRTLLESAGYTVGEQVRVPTTRCAGEFDVIVTEEDQPVTEDVGVPVVVIGEFESRSEDGRCAWPIHERVFLDLVARTLRGEAGGDSSVIVTPAKPSMRILVAEDNPINQRVARSMIRRWGYDVDIAVDGESAVRVASDVSYDLILMDLHMPLCDGFDATRRIREGEAGRRPAYIVACSADVRDDTRRRCLDCGMDSFLRKPIDSVELADLIAAREAVVV